jgi:DNA-binding transcriptional MerR regulator
MARAVEAPKMKELTVKQLAVLSGVTVRTLHHYDEIGLLKPTTVAANGYRLYGREAWLRLQDILLHREMGVPLADIARLLDTQGADRVTALRRHRETLARERERFGALIATIDRTIESLEDKTPMIPADLYKGISPEKQAEYEEQLIQSRGPQARAEIAHANAAFARSGPSGQHQAMEELRAVETGLAAALAKGTPANDPSLTPLLERHRGWVARMWDRPCPPEAYAGLAAMYESHPDFRTRYEAIAPGFTAFLCAAMRAHAAR